MIRSALVSLLCLVASMAGAEPLRVFAAASLKGPLDEIFPDAVIAYGGSGGIARQVMAGAPADLVILANTAWMDELADAGAIDAGEMRDVASNSLVLIGADGAAPLPSPLTAEAVLDRLGPDGRLAIGLTRAVPAGIYGRAALEGLGLWEALTPRLAEVDNVRTALALVARGEAPLGLVYGSDAQVVGGVSVVAHLPAESHPPIRYPAAPVAGGNRDAALAALERLTGPEGQAILQAAGFAPPVAD